MILLMGVSGAGKTTIGQLLASDLGWEFIDADDYHSLQNVEKMRSGIPLTDADRGPWLKSLRELIADRIASEKNAVLACSALKQAYREELQLSPEVKLVYLQGSVELLRQRLHKRVGHFMTEAMLDSQLASLETPVDAAIVNIDQPPEAIVREIRVKLRLTQT